MTNIKKLLKRKSKIVFYLFNFFQVLILNSFVIVMGFGLQDWVFSLRSLNLLEIHQIPNFIFSYTTFNISFNLRFEIYTISFLKTPKTVKCPMILCQKNLSDYKRLKTVQKCFWKNISKVEILSDCIISSCINSDVQIVTQFINQIE